MVWKQVRIALLVGALAVTAAVSARADDPKVAPSDGAPKVVTPKEAPKPPASTAVPELMPSPGTPGAVVPAPVMPAPVAPSCCTRTVCCKEWVTVPFTCTRTAYRFECKQETYTGSAVSACRKFAKS